MFFSPSNPAIYSDSLYDEYLKAGTWPSDVVEISDEMAKEFHPTQQPVDKILGAGKDGLPKWVDIPEPDKATLIQRANLNKKSLMQEADAYTRPWQTQLLLDMISDEDKASLTMWMLYYKKLQAIDTSDPYAIVWPEKPTS
jgi:hypothetical protein